MIVAFVILATVFFILGGLAYSESMSDWEVRRSVAVLGLVVMIIFFGLSGACVGLGVRELI